MDISGLQRILLTELPKLSTFTEDEKVEIDFNRLYDMCIEILDLYEIRITPESVEELSDDFIMFNRKMIFLGMLIEVDKSSDSIEKVRKSLSEFISKTHQKLLNL